MISIITTTWNRKEYLIKIHQSLIKQSNAIDFEWIIADDGSIDDTEKEIEKFINNRFKIKYIKSDLHVGKATMDNIAISESKGEFLIWCDSDDYLEKDALQKLMNCYEELTSEDKKKYIGVVGMCASQEKILNSHITNQENFNCKINQLEHKYGMKEDATFFIKKNKIKNYKFPEVDMVVPESSLWAKIGCENIRVCTDVVMIKNYGSKNAISFVKSLKYNRGHAYALALIEENQSEYKPKILYRIKRNINFYRHCIHGDIIPDARYKMWPNKNKLYQNILNFIAFIISLHDISTKEIIKTHNEFELSKNKQKIKISIL